MRLQVEGRILLWYRAGPSTFGTPMNLLVRRVSIGSKWSYTSYARDRGLFFATRRPVLELAQLLDGIALSRSAQACRLHDDSPLGRDSDPVDS